MIRNDDLPDIVRKTEIELMNLKQRQFSGSSNVISYVTETSNTWDLDYFPPSMPPIPAVRITEVAFTADSQIAPFVSLEMDIFIGGTRYAGQNDPFFYYVFDYQLSSDSNIAQRQRGLRLIAMYGFNIRTQIKFRATATDTGSLSWRSWWA